MFIGSVEVGRISMCEELRVSSALKKAKIFLYNIHVMYICW